MSKNLHHCSLWDSCHCERAGKLPMTSREFLYHLPCESSARKMDSFGSRWLAPETAVWAGRVVMSPPAFRHDLGFFTCVEQLAVQKLRPHFAR
jgi:hypothetical protein